MNSAAFAVAGSMAAAVYAEAEEANGVVAKLKEVFRRYRSQPVERVIEVINPILRGWVNYFAVGHSSRCFSYDPRLGGKEDPAAPDACPETQGFGWKRWSREWIYGTLGLFNGYRVRPASPAESRPSTIGPITLDAKQTGERSAGNPHATFDVAGAGNVARCG